MIRPLLSQELEALRWQFRRDKLIVVPELFDPHICRRYFETVRTVAQNQGTRIDKPAGGPGAIGDEPLQYTVLTGEQVRDHLPTLFAWVTSYEFKSFLRPFLGPVLMPGDDGCALTEFVNVNYLKGSGAKYQFHTDNFPYTGLLFLQDFGADGGGELEAHCRGFTISVPPRAGSFILFDGSRIPHRVNPLCGLLEERVSVPISLHNQIYQRTPEMDAYLYTEAQDVGTI